MTSERSTPIPYVDLATPHRALVEPLLEAARRVIESGQFVLGPDVERFEECFAALCGTRHAISVHSGTDALVLALAVLGVGPGDEVITPTNSFVSSASAIALTGARPVLADVLDDYTIDPDSIERAIGPRTRAIVPVHLTGRPADMDAISALAERHGLAVVEDAAQAVLAEHRGRRVGAIGTMGCFSLHPLKTLNACGDGGVVVTDDDRYADALRLRRNLGLASREDAVLWERNSRLDSLQAAFLLVKLPHLEAWTEARRAHAAAYRSGLSGVNGLHVPADAAHTRCVYHTFVVQTERRDALREALAAQGIGTAVHYPVPIHLQTVGRSLGYGPGDFPNAERQAERILSLPVYPELSPADRDRVIDAIARFHDR